VPLRARIAFFGAAVVAITVVVFSVVVYLLVEHDLYAQQDAQLAHRGQQVWAELQATRHSDLSQGRFLGRIDPDSLFPRVDLRAGTEPFIEILDTTGSPVFSSGTIDGDAPHIPSTTLTAAGVEQGMMGNIRLKGNETIRVYILRWSRPDISATGYVVAGQPIVGITRQLTTLRIFLIAGALLSLLTALAASWLLARRALRPIEDAAKTAEEIGRTQNLSRRLPEQQTRDEIGRLQASFNQMLQQLEDAYRRLQDALAAQRRFVADASHELRTPLTSLRGNIGLLLRRRDITVEDRQAALHDIADETERMSRLVQDLLTLARADTGQHLERTSLDLRALVQDVCRRAQALQGERRLEVEDGLPAHVMANPDSLKQLLWNLLDNALKHTRGDGHVVVRISPNRTVARLTVSDDGPGIPRANLERIFERFYQADPARSGEGAGLGLAIARWIVQQHGGRIIAENNADGGATFRVELPLARS